MSDTPKRRGRPPKVRPIGEAVQERVDMQNESAPFLTDVLVNQEDLPSPQQYVEMLKASIDGPYSTGDFRIKSGRLQRAWQHPTGTQWRDVPAVADDAPDWDDSQ